MKPLDTQPTPDQRHGSPAKSHLAPPAAASNLTTMRQSDTSLELRELSTSQIEALIQPTAKDSSTFAKESVDQSSNAEVLSPIKARGRRGRRKSSRMMKGSSLLPQEEEQQGIQIKSKAAMSVSKLNGLKGLKPRVELSFGLEETIDIGGEKFSERDIMKFIENSEHYPTFKVRQFLQATLYHILFLSLTPLLGNPLIWAIESVTGGSHHTLHNLAFYSKIAPTQYAQTLESVLCAAAFCLFLVDYIRRSTNPDDFDPDSNPMFYNYFDFIVVFFCRAALIGVKYGYFSKEHWHLFRNTRLSPNVLFAELLFTLTFEERPDLIKKRVYEALDRLQIRPEHFKLYFYQKVQPQYVLKQRAMFARMQDPEIQDEYFTLMGKIADRDRKITEYNKENSTVNVTEEKEIKQSLQSHGRLDDAEIPRTIKFSKLFGKLVENHRYLNSDQQLCEDILMERPIAEVQGLNAVLEIYYFSLYSRTRLTRIVLGVCIFYNLMPWILRLLSGRALFESVEQGLVECLIFLPKLYVVYVASLFMLFLNSFYQQKLKFKKTFMAMLDQHYQQVYRLDRFLPKLTPYCPVNLDSLFDLHQVLQEMDAKYIRRAQIYNVFLQVTFSIQALYIYVHLMLETKTVADFGETYVLNALTIFIYCFVFSGFGFLYAAEANTIDVDVKKKLMALSQDVNRIHVLARWGKLRRLPDNSVSVVARDKPCASGSEDISRAVAENCEILEETLERKVELIDYMLVHEKLSHLIGPTLSYDFFFQGAIVFFSIVFTMLQKLLSM